MISYNESSNILLKSTEVPHSGINLFLQMHKNQVFQALSIIHKFHIAFFNIIAWQINLILYFCESINRPK
jgi:hypothetical protein